MPRFGLCGPAYTSQSVNADAQSCVNLYLEAIESQAGNAPLVLYSTPGTKKFVDLARAVSPQVNGIGAFETFDFGGGTGTAVTTPSLTPQQASELALFVEGSNSATAGTFTAAAGWTNFTSGKIFAQVVSAAIAGAGTLSVGGGWATLIALFKLFGGVIPTPLTSCGVGGSLGSPQVLPMAPGPNTAGNTILAVLNVGNNAGTPTGIVPTDTNGNTYVQLAQVFANNAECHIWVATNIKAGANTVNLPAAAFGSVDSNFEALELPAGSAAVNNTGPVRGLYFINGRAFGVCGQDFDELFANGTYINRGTVSNDSLPVTMAATPQQLLLASAGTAYVFDLMANTLTAIPGSTFSGPVSQAGVCDGFFLLTIQDTKEFVVSAPLDATDWVTNGSAIVSVFADNIVSMLVHDREIHFWSDRERTVYYDSGNIFPFDVIPGTTIQAGSAAKNSPARLDDRVLWLNSDDNGTATVKMGIGYTPQRISTYALEFALRSYVKNGRIDDAVGYTYQDQGHSFYVLYFPTPSKTWVYDATMSQAIGVPCWHEREYYLAATGGSQAHHSQCHMFAFGKHLVGDWSSGKVYDMEIPELVNGTTWKFADDDGNIIRRVRRAPHISQEQMRIFINELRVYVETGLGPQPAFPAPAIGPNEIFLADDDAALWRVSIDDSGTINAVLDSSGVAATIFLNDAFEPGTSWKLSINGGVLFGTSVPYNASYQTSYPMATTPSSLQTAITFST